MSYQIQRRLGRQHLRSVLWGLAVGVSLGACTSTVPDSSPPGPPTTDASPRDGAAVWASQCASCHGDWAEGGVAPALSDWRRGRDALVQTIDATMPLGAPEACAGACAEAVADYLLDALQRAAPSCEAPIFPPRQLRLLTRREYQRTVQDLLGAPGGAEGTACTGLTECAWSQESCEQGRCVPDPCGRSTFWFDPGAETLRSVVVAGDFNGWAPRPEDGAWPLTFQPELGRWVLKRELEPGRHTYKFVLNGDRWVSDPQNPSAEPDGFGGQNSVVSVDCSMPAPAELDLTSLTAGFPVESRPAGYPYDNGAEAGFVSAVHVGEYMKAAGQVADLMLAAPGPYLGCASADVDCLRAAVVQVGQEAYRRPLLAAERSRLAGLVAAGASPQDGLRVALTVIFTSPSFLYRSELGTQNSEGTYDLGPYEVASAISYLLWGSAPDAELRAAAAAGQLQTPEQRAAQAQRLLRDPRAREVVTDFALQWLGADRVLGKVKHPSTYPGFDRALREAALEETRRLVEHVVFEGSGRLAELFEADYTFVDGRLAALYGLPDQGAQAHRAEYGEGGRAGVLGHASVLATYAHSDQSSPILRGVFVRERLLCQKFGRPPANAGGVPEVDPNATTRERFRQHTDDPVCSSCHQYIDELGFGFERYDAVGAYRESENGQPIDGRGDLNDVEGFGTQTNAPYASLRELGGVLANSRSSKLCFTTQYWRYALGRMERPEDVCGLDDLMTDFEATGFDVRGLMVALVKSPTFVTRQ